jgi:hypothetical protein
VEILTLVASTLISTRGTVTIALIDKVFANRAVETVGTDAVVASVSTSGNTGSCVGARIAGATGVNYNGTMHKRRRSGSSAK